ncbi:MAG: thioredoxin domain-containing protein [Gemmatimonadales bacterium]|nr:thioredoxin domain-containing protein [Gemmatimonadales bacterium]
MNRFFVVLGAVGAVGAVAIGWMLMRPTSPSIPANVTVTASDTAGFRGYVLGRADAPVEVVEYADYQCPACAQFEAVQFPDVRQRLIESGRVRWRYRDFPLDQHRWARLAAHAAACADEQGRFWDVHALIYAGQADWERSGDAGDLFASYGDQAGLDRAKYDACMQSTRHAGRIQASLNEGMAAGVSSTPTFLIGGRLFAGILAADRLKQIADSIAPVASAAK